MHQRCSSYALTNLLFGLWRSVWAIDCLSIFLVHILELQHAHVPPKCYELGSAPQLLLLLLFSSLDSHLNPSRSLGVCHFASSILSSLKIIKSTPFFKFSFCGVHCIFDLFFSLNVGRLKCFANYYVSSSISLECFHRDKIVLLFSLSLTCLHTSLFWRLSGGVKNSLVLVSLDIFPSFVFLLCSLLLYPLRIMSQNCKTRSLDYVFFFFTMACVIFGTIKFLRKMGYYFFFYGPHLDVCLW